MKKKLIRYLYSSLLVLISFFFFSFPAFSADPTVTSAPSSSSQGLGCGGGMGPIGDALCNILSSNDKEVQNAQVANSLNTLISGIISLITILGGIWFLVQFIIGGFQWISAGADKGLLEIARLRMLHAAIGLMILVASYMVVGLIGNLLGLDIFNPGESILKVVIG